MIRIGVLLPVPRNDYFLVALREGLRDAGWTNEGDVEFEIRRANGTVEEFRRFGRELAALPLNVLVTASTAAATALTQSTTTIPVVFLGTFDPVAAGLVASLEHPGGNVTGIAGFQADIGSVIAGVARSSSGDDRSAPPLSFHKPRCGRSGDGRASGSCHLRDC